MQCQRHLDPMKWLSVFQPSESTHAAKVPSCSARLAFVCGDLSALSEFVRAGLRLAAAQSLPQRSQGLVITDRLQASDCWGDASDTEAAITSAPRARRLATCPALSVRRLVLAICCPGAARPDARAAPAFIVDYVVEALDAQLGSP
jgi:hypothetical protein